MTTQLLIYESAVPISKEKHKDWSVKTGTNFDFAQQVNSVPLTAVEFASAAADYAIVFAGNEKALMPAVILGVRDKENLYVSETGNWKVKFVPAFFRRYPFVFASNDEGESFTLCIDESFSGFNEEGRGERLFDSDGEITQYLQSVLNFSKEYQGHFKRTQIFCAKLQELDLLEPMQAQITSKTGQQLNLGGFMAVNRQRLKGLSDEKIVELAKTDELELIYLHLQSMRNFTAMVERMAEHDEASQAAVDEEVPAETETDSSAEEEDAKAKEGLH